MRRTKAKNPDGRALGKDYLIDATSDGVITYRTRGAMTIRPEALPVYSVDTEEEAKMLQVRFCKLTYDGFYKLNPDIQRDPSSIGELFHRENTARGKKG